ncbi:hypothetical protein HanIR_Chr05g0245031 [Helianthus annuus]|nr:hypothetical protein HanIR_Chr05g0245031 [Helianthus annuus]
MPETTQLPLHHPHSIPLLSNSTTSHTTSSSSPHSPATVSPTASPPPTATHSSLVFHTHLTAYSPISPALAARASSSRNPSVYFRL